MKRNLVFLLFFLLFSFLISCSSAPKRAMVVTDTYELAYSRLESANEDLLSGKLQNARMNLSQSYNLALSIDNAPLLCKVCLSGVSYKILESQVQNQNETENQNENSNEENQKNSAYSKSFLDEKVDFVLDEAKSAANRSTDRKPLLDLCKVYEVQKNLVDLDSDKALDEKNLLAVLDSSEKSVSKEPYYLGYLERTRGDVFMKMNDFEGARKSYLSAAEIHTKSRYIYEIGLDYYKAARASSLSGDKKNAVSAIESALKYDRDAENSAAISLDYLAYSKILLKGNPMEEDVKKAESLKNLSEKIAAASEKF